MRTSTFGKQDARVSTDAVCPAAAYPIDSPSPAYTDGLVCDGVLDAGNAYAKPKTKKLQPEPCPSQFGPVSARLRLTHWVTIPKLSWAHHYHRRPHRRLYRASRHFPKAATMAANVA